MATTSLARQLEQLRATTVEPQKLSVAQQGPNILSGVQLSGEQLTLLAKDAFEKICDICPSVAHFKNAIFQGDQVNVVHHLVDYNLMFQTLFIVLIFSPVRSFF